VTLSEVLQASGYQVDSYATAEAMPFCNRASGRCTCQVACADLLLTDNRMPALTGLEMLELQQRKGCKLSQGNRAVLSGTWTLEEKRQAEQLGCKVFEKPFDLALLDSWLEACKKIS
jgi:CheY-like chemotaxis protein